MITSLYILFDCNLIFSNCDFKSHNMTFILTFTIIFFYFKWEAGLYTYLIQEKGKATSTLTFAYISYV